MKKEKEIKKADKPSPSTFNIDVSDTDDQIAKADKTTSNLLSAWKEKE